MNSSDSRPAFTWRKLGKVFAANGEHGWIHSHAQVPTAIPLPELGVIRVYFAPRPKPDYSLTTFLDVDLTDPTKVVYVHNQPILLPGPAGSFDENGIMPQCAIRRGKEIWLYYAGWSRRVSIPYSNWTGLAVSTDGGKSFRRAFSGPVLDRTLQEIYSGTGLFVVPTEGDVLRGFYATGRGWEMRHGRQEELYVIAAAESNDGINWQRTGAQLLPSQDPEECTTRPSVIRFGGKWHMWYCYRGRSDFRDGPNAYRIGYAHSDDLDTWTRSDEQAGIAPSSSGWDSTMTAYPYVIEADGELLMFYNGNGFGRSGFGVARLDRS